MPVFAYAARAAGGQRVEGTVQAPDRRAAAVLVERQGQVPIWIREAGQAAGETRRARRLRSPRRSVPRMGTRDLLLFTTELSDLLASGMTLGNALQALSRRKTGRPLDAIVAGLRDEILHGSSLSDALARYPNTFSNLYVSMIRAGEASGGMTEVLRRLVEHYDRIQQVKEKVIMAMVYPAIVLTMGLATLVFAMVYVIPKFQIVFQSMGQALPLPTQILIGLSRGIVRYGWLVAIGVLLTSVLMHRTIQTPQGRLAWDGFLLKLPFVRGIVASAIYANFARTLGSLLANGVPVLEALRIVERTVGNAVIGEEIRNARERVTDGTTISGPLAAGRVFPQVMTDMLAVGEQTGDVPGALGHIARRYENELDRHVKIFTTALEPILIVLIALGVGFVAISILMAVFNLTQGLNV